MSVLIPGLYGLDAATAWRTLEKDSQKYRAKFAKDKTVQKEVEYFNKAAAKLTKVDDLFKDRRLLRFVLDSYGLGSEINNVGRLKKVLTEDPTKQSSLVNRLMDTRFKTMATDLRLDGSLSKLKLQIHRDGIQQKYLQSEFEEALGDQDPALRQAAYFARQAGGIGDIYAVLGDKILRDVVQNTLNIPAQLAIQPVETQARAISSRLDIKKFAAADGTSGITAGQLTRAKTDFSLLESGLKISDAATAQIKILQDSVSKLADSYALLPSSTDPSGVNAATIAKQEIAVPELLRYDALLRAGNAHVGDIRSGITSLLNLVEQGKKSGSDMAALKTQFASLVTDIQSGFATTASMPDGSNQALFNGVGADDTLSTEINAAGTNITINRFNSSTLSDIVNAAKTAFDAAGGSGDSANLLAAQGRLLTLGDRMDVIAGKISDDLNNFSAAIAGQEFYAALNSDALLGGKRSVDDGLSRIAKIDDLLGKIGTLATQSAARTPSEDRADLITQYDAYRNEIRELITVAGDAGFDNFLNNAPDQTYEVRAGFNLGVKGGYDLLTNIADRLDAGNLGSQSDAQALSLAVATASVAADDAKNGLNAAKPALDLAVGIFDPKAKLDSALLGLREALQTTLDNATVEGKNLLSADQSDIRQDMTTGSSIRFRAQSGLGAALQADLDAAIAQMNASPANLVSALTDALDTINGAKRVLDSDNRVATVESGKLAGTIDLLSPKVTANVKNPYDVNEFTQKFLVRYLTMAGGQGGSNNGANSYLLTLLGGSSNSANPSAVISSLIAKL